MTAGAPLARTARERGSSTLHRMLADARVALFVAYVAMVIWRFRGDGTPANWWMYVLAYAALNAALDGAARLQRWWIWRRSVHALRAMDPTQRDERLAGVWMSGTRRVLAGMVAGEGEADVGGAVERYPFARGTRHAAAGTFCSARGRDCDVSNCSPPDARR